MTHDTLVPVAGSALTLRPGRVDMLSGVHSATLCEWRFANRSWGDVHDTTDIVLTGGHTTVKSGLRPSEPSPNYEAFVQQLLRRIAIAADVSFEQLEQLPVERAR